MKLNQILPYVGSGVVVFYGCPIDADNDFTKPLTLETAEHAINGYKNFVVELALKPIDDLTEVVIKSKLVWASSPDNYSATRLKNRLKTNTISYRDMMMLIEMGYDVFDAIPTGRAVNINRIEIPC